MKNDAATEIKETVIICRDLCASYGREDVIHNVSLEVEKGMFLPFIGPNGAGKTTLLRIILGLLKPRKGTLITPFNKQVPGYVPQHKVIDPLYPVSVIQIVMMGLYPETGWWRKPNKEQKYRVEKALDQFDLSVHVQKNFSELSGGMKQKAMLARALVTNADIFILDEPTSDLDESSEKAVINHLFHLSKDEGKTILMAAHGIEMINELAPKLCLVRQGNARIIENDKLKADVISVL